MTSVNLADAKAKLSALIERAERGEDIVITRHGRPVARLTAMAGEPKPINLQALKTFRSTLPLRTDASADLLRDMRNEDL